MFLILLFAGLLIYLLLSAVLDLTNKKDIHTVTIDGAFEVLELEHSINGLIPIGTDYYYIGIEEETFDAYIIKASKKWLEKNFDSDYMAINPEGMQITALAKKVSDYETARELQTRAAQIEELQYPLGTEYCLDLGYRQTAIVKLLLIVWLVLLLWVIR
ncbi:MAG: hypothetical protein ACI4HQ_08160 [Acetatifactor sp.]